MTNSADEGAGSLRQAILDANGAASGAPHTITFGGSCASGCTIFLQSGLPDIMRAVNIVGPVDGSDRPLVTLDGSSAPGAHGLLIDGAAGPSAVSGLSIINFSGAGIFLNGGGGHTITGNFIGVRADGVTDGGASAAGIQIDGSSGNTIGGTDTASPGLSRNVISGTGGTGIQIIGAAATGNRVQGNIIGLGVDGETPLFNTTGIRIASASGNIIGGDNGDSASVAAGKGNTISGNRKNVIIAGEVAGPANSNVVRGNRIGTNGAGTTAKNHLSIFGPGLEINGSNGSAASNLINENTISGNQLDGVYITGNGADNNTVTGNRVGVAQGTSAAVPNLRDGVRIESSGASGNSITNNTIANNGGFGINIISATGNSCSGNTFSANVAGESTGCSTSAPPPVTPSPGTSTVIASGGPVVAGGSATVTVTVKDAAGSTVPGASLTLSSNRGAVDTITTAQPVTADGGGVATFTVTSATAGTGVFTAVINGTITVTQTASVQFVAGEPAAAPSTVSASPTSAAVGGTSTVTVTLKDAHQNVVSGRTVSVSSTLGIVTAVQPASGGDGVATFTVTSSTAGTAVLTATVQGGVTVQQTASVLFFASGTRTLGFKVLRQPPGQSGGAHVAAGFAFGFAVEIEDSTGAQVLDSSTQVTLQLTDSVGAPVAAVLTCSNDQDPGPAIVRSMAQGVAQFAGCRVSQAGTGFMLRATAPNLNGGSSVPFDVRVAGDADNACAGATPPATAVDIVDFSLLLRGFGKNHISDGTAFDANVDFDGSRTTDIVDFSILLSRFGTAC